MKTETAKQSIEVKFYTYLWDNYQGGSGKPIVLKRHIELDTNVHLGNVWYEVITHLDQEGYKDSWNIGGFKGNGIIHIKLL